MIPSNYSIKLIDLKDDININKVLNEYPIYDENYRKILNQKILDRYAFDDIGFETPFMFAHFLKVRLNEIMPKYNMIYQSEIMKIDPLLNFSLKEQQWVVTMPVRIKRHQDRVKQQLCLFRADIFIRP